MELCNYHKVTAFNGVKSNTQCTSKSGKKKKNSKEEELSDLSSDKLLPVSPTPKKQSKKQSKLQLPEPRTISLSGVVMENDAGKTLGPRF